MKKAHLVMLGVMALAAGVVNGHQGSHGASESQVVVFDEAAFIAKLSASHHQIFNLMTAEQKLAVFSIAASTTADAAVDAVMQEHKLALVDGELKAHQ